MYKVWTLALTTLREMLREKVFMVSVLIAVVLLALSLLLGALSFLEQRKILTDFGFMAIQISGLGIALFSGSYMLAKEIEKQTCLLILSRPISRDQFILGKMFGVLFLNTLVMGSLGVLLFVLLGLWRDAQMIAPFLKIILSLWCENFVVLSLAVLFSLVVRPVLALGAGIMTFLLGHWLGDLTYFANKSGEALFVYLVKGLHWVTPQFYKMNWKSFYFLENGISSGDVLWMLGHMLSWATFLILITNFLFRRKDIV